MTAARRDTLLAELRERAADRPAHAKALEQIIAWYTQWGENPNDAPADSTEGLPASVSARVTIALDDDVAYAFWSDATTRPPRAYSGRRSTDAQAAADRTRSRDRIERLLAFPPPTKPGATR